MFTLLSHCFVAWPSHFVAQGAPACRTLVRSSHQGAPAVPRACRLPARVAKALHRGCLIKYAGLVWRNCDTKFWNPDVIEVCPISKWKNMYTSKRYYYYYYYNTMIKNSYIFNGMIYITINSDLKIKVFYSFHFSLLFSSSLSNYMLAIKTPKF